MSGGHGSTPWGGGPWGGAGADYETDFDMPETVTLSESLSISLPLKLLAAVPLNLNLVELTFSHDLDAFAPHTSAANYTILPSLQVLSASVGADPRTIRVQTDHQGPVLYTVTVGSARSTGSDILQPAFSSASFLGFDAAPSFFATAQGPRKVMLTFSQPMLQDAAFSTAANYSLQDLNGTAIPVTAVAPQGNDPISRVTLTLGSDLARWGRYVAEVGVPVKTTTGLNVAPNTNLFQWADMSGVVSRGPLVIPLSSFTGEVSGGLHGTPAGQVFFSPALTTAAANSVIQVEEVACCTRAYDAYSFPNPPDPYAFFTFGNPAAQGALGSLTSVLWGPADIMGQARVQLSDTREEIFVPTAEESVTFTLREPIATTAGGFMNDSRWHLFDGSPTSFTIADNSAPIGPGPTTTTTMMLASEFDSDFDPGEF